MRLTQIPPGEVGRHIQLLAEKHAVTYTPTHHDNLATVLTNLSGDDVVLDEIENLLLALE